MESNRRTIAIIGSCILMLGFILPVVSLLGFVSFSYFDLLTKASARFITGLVILALGGISLALALKSNFKPLIVTGGLALAILVFDFITYKRALMNLAHDGRIRSGAAGDAQFGQIADELAGVVLQPAWGMFVMVLGAILLIVSGAMGDKLSSRGTDWNNNPPPPMNYS